MLTQLDPALDLHDRILSDLDRRDAAIAEQEAEARRVLEQALAQCSAERASIDQDRVLLTQVKQLYCRFVQTNGAGISEDDEAPQKLVPEAPPSTTVPETRARVESLMLVDSSVKSRIATTMRDLRSQLIAEQTKAA